MNSTKTLQNLKNQVEKKLPDYMKKWGKVIINTDIIKPETTNDNNIVEKEAEDAPSNSQDISNMTVNYENLSSISHY